MGSDVGSAPGVPRWAGALTGLLVVAVALAVGHVVAIVIAGAASPLFAVGETLIDASPQWLKEWAIRSFGSNDKAALLLGITTVLAVLAAALGTASRRRRWLGFAGLGILTAVGVMAALGRPVSNPSWVIPSLVAGAAGVGAFALLTRSWGRGGSPAQEVAEERPEPRLPSGFDRRRFLEAAFAMGAAAIAAGGVSRVLRDREVAATGRNGLIVPQPKSTAAPLPAGAELDVAGMGPFYTAATSFYRVDTALLVPQIDVKEWRLRIHGMVQHEMELDFAQLVGRDLIERDITLNCVSNEVGGHYIGNARWIGAPLAPLLDEAGVLDGATQIVSRSPDGMTIGTPTAIARDGRDAMLAVAMNGQPLPFEHGFPVRMLVPGLYGYESGTKWVEDLELTTLEAFDAYWVKRGWAQQVAVKTASRIDTPRNNANVGAGTVPVGGVAWAQHRGIARVEVRVDGGAWNEATLAAQDTIDTWRQWTWPWTASPGRHTLEVRATDATGTVQTGASASPFPSGATGWHMIDVTIR